MRRWLLAACTALALAGCSYRELRTGLERLGEASYEQSRRQRLEACERALSEPAREDCRARLPPETLEEYDRARQSVPAAGGAQDLRARQPAPRKDRGKVRLGVDS